MLQLLVFSPLLSRLFNKHLRIVFLKPNKDLAYLNELFEAGRVVPVIDRVYKLEDVPDALRLFGTGDHKGKIIVTAA
ncbi:MAG TPA: zinc-binding dehydrogenase [Vicinamibacterales bacterium]|nr:zinc-binding dehydrogenase [Vicinamibacterales bacterium]